MNELTMLKRQNTLRANCLAPQYRKEWKSLLGYLEFGRLTAFEEQLIAKELINHNCAEFSSRLHLCDVSLPAA